MIGSLTSGRLVDLRDVAVARALSLFTPFVGFIGRVIFMSSNLLGVRTYEEHSTTYSANFHEHELIQQKPVSEFLGAGLHEHNFKITLLSSLKIEPQTEVNLLQRMCDSGNPYLMFLNGWIVGRFTIRSVNAVATEWHLGRPSVIEVDLSLKEYVKSLPIEAVQKQRQEELTRGETGVGGPDNIADPPEKLVERTLKPSIDPITRMPINA